VAGEKEVDGDQSGFIMRCRVELDWKYSGLGLGGKEAWEYGGREGGRVLRGRRSVRGYLRESCTQVHYSPPVPPGSAAGKVISGKCTDTSDEEGTGHWALGYHPSPSINTTPS